jgi:hypothetical protein
MIGKLDAAAFLLRPPLGTLAAGENAAAHDREHLQLSLKLLVEQITLHARNAASSP